MAGDLTRHTRLISVGKGIGPEILAPVRRAVSTIFTAD
jgi:hypothetical protein